MKKNYINKLIVACLFLSVHLSAQLSGVYTINNALATAGNNYNSFTAFAAAITASGVTGPVIVNVNPTTPYVEQVNFPQYTGASAINSVTINGNGATLTFNATLSGAPHTLMLSGADYMFWNNLNVVGTGPTYALVIHLYNNSDYNYFLNCTSNSPLNGTSSLQVPLSVDGTATSPTGLGPSGNYNTFDGCQMIGGYYNTVFYGNSVSPFPTGNVVKNCIMRDFYVYGVYHVYTINSIFKNNTVDNLNRTTITTRYGIYMSTGSTGCQIDGNKIQRLFQNNPANANSAFCIYLTVSSSLNNENIVKNNLVSDINSNGPIYGIYIPGYSYNNVFHNTVSIDDPTATGGAVYGIYATMATNIVKNNIVTISRAGSGTKYGYYFGTTPTIPANYNVVWMGAPAGLNYAYYVSANYATLGALQGVYQGLEQNSVSTDPIYTNTSVANYVPTSTLINNMCPFVGVTTDITGFLRSTASPDPGAYETYTVPCVGSAPPNSVATPTGVLCQNTNITIGLATSFTNTGYSVQWQQATASILGPYTAIPGATLPVFNTNTLTTTTFYNMIITCANGGSPVTALAGSVQIALPVINNVPYTEGFEGISKTNQLPNCSWAASSSYTSTLTYTSNGTNNRFPNNGQKFASFYSSPAGVNYFYTNGINMVTGITYSAAINFINEQVGYSPWSDLSILVGSTQSPVGQTSIVSTTAAVVSYSLLSGTFTVPTTGVYYIAIRATTGSGCSPYLSFDDVSVTIPCQLNYPPLQLNTSSSIVCSGLPVVFTASGANTYSYSSGQIIPQIAITPSVSGLYSVMGTSALSGCTKTITQFITVLPSPPVVAFASKMVICEGETTNLTAQGANSYNWSTGTAGQNISVSPTTSTSYSVIGVNLYGCATQANIIIAVNSLPNVTASVPSTMVCKGDNVTFIGNGASTYQWASTSALVQFGTLLNTVVQTSGAYTVTGTDANGCVGKYLFTLDVEECTGINELSNSQNDITAYPNPNSGVFNIESKQGGVKSIEIYDVTGRNVYSGVMNNNATKINISEMPNGVYSVKVKTGEAIKYFKVIKAQ